jgi:ferredoxin
MHVEVDRERCCGSGNCVMLLPEVFDQDDAEGLVVLRQPEPPETQRDTVQKAVLMCPAGAIQLVAS